VNEVGDFAGLKSGAVSAFAIDGRTSKLKLLNQVPSGGAGPCHISLDKTGKFVLVANYDGGSIASFPIREDGSLSSPASFVQHHGSSVNKERQEGPHAHWIGASPDNRFVLAADLGLDEVLIYRFDATKGTLSPNNPPFVKVDGGAGPRHFAFHPNGKFEYVLTEMAATVTAFSYDSKNGALSASQTIATLPKGHSGPTEAAELVVHPSGKFLYASNRAGIDTITAFAIDPAKGTLKLIERFSTRGKTPRNFVIDPTGSYLLAANQESGNIVIFRIDPATGTLTPTVQEVRVPAPVCITFITGSNKESEQHAALGSVPSTVSGSTFSSSKELVYRAGANAVGIPVCLMCPNPEYTNEGRAAGIQGTITLQIVVTPDGRVENAVVIEAVGYGLEQKAIEAVKRWRLRPAVGPDGKQVTVSTAAEITFRLNPN
jgi:6-phosphogluconolactonase